MEPGQIVGEKYKIIRELGRGAMGAVFEVEHVFIKKRFALKSINPELAKNPEFRARALRESQASAAIRHPNIVDVSDFGETSDGSPYIVMEFLQGRPLTDIIDQEAPMTIRRALTFTREILAGLDAAHKAGIVHRDIKPDNIFVLEESTPEAPRIKIVDFGISKMRTTEEGMTLTRTNAVMGTPYYMSLEQCRGAKDVDGRADIFSVGVILFEMLSRRIPFEADTFAELVVKMVKAERTSLAEAAPWLPSSLVVAVEKATAVEREDRFSSATEMLQETNRLLETLPGLDSPPGQSGQVPEKGMHPISGTAATAFEQPSDETVEHHHGRDEITEQVDLPLDAGQDDLLPAHPAQKWLLPAVGVGVVLAIAIGFFVLRSSGAKKEKTETPEQPKGSVSEPRDAGLGHAPPRDARPASPVQPMDASAPAKAQAEDAGSRPKPRHRPRRPSRHRSRTRARSRTRPQPRADKPARPQPRPRPRTRPRPRPRSRLRFRLKTDD